MRSAIAIAAAGFLAVTGCSEHPPTPMLERSIPVDVALDVVFVVDNSGSMLAEQQKLTAAFPGFLEALRRIGGHLPDLHLGVLSSNAGSAGQGSVPGCTLLGDDGHLLTGPPGNTTCATQHGLSGDFISDVGQPDGTRVLNYTPGQLAPLFTCMATLGTNGCGFEMHLESMYRALQPGKNAGFLRDEAWLAVVFLADEDDCSTEVGVMFGDPTATLTSPLGPRTSFRCHEFGVVCDADPTPRAFGTKVGCRPRGDSAYMFEVERYVSFLRGLKPDPTRVVVAGLIGDFDAGSGTVTVGPDPNNATFPAVQRSCQGLDLGNPDDGAAPAVRLQAFLRAFPARHVFSSICGASLQDGMDEVAALLEGAIGSPCVDQPLADAEDAPGLQPDCTVTEAVGTSRAPIPQCPEPVQAGPFCDPGVAATPCWCIRPDAVQCPATLANPESHAFDVNRSGVTPAPGTSIEVRCTLAP